MNANQAPQPAHPSHAVPTNAPSHAVPNAGPSHAGPPSIASLTSGSLSRRRLLSALLLAPPLAALLAACGDTTKGQGANPDPTTAPSNPGTTPTSAPATEGTGTPGTSGAGAIEHPTGADDVIVRLGFVNGFVPVGYAFMNLPTVLISGDGRVITQGATTAIFPGPLLPALDVRTITEAGIQKVLAKAEEAALLAPPPDYSAELTVADAPDTRLEISARGETFIHQAPALGFQDPDESKPRLVLHGFSTELGDIETLVGAENLGEAAPLVAETYRFQARPMTAEDLAGYTEEPKPTEVPWPVELGVTLASAAECAEIDAEKVGALFSDANQLTFFVEDGTTYMVAVVAVLPGDTC